ncbi:MAG: hypothetical protein LBR23_09290 [Spirochaetaceae bacterium]|jgi:hypothetical protein|nr:hypothetical protein [Spirochaetaceae bacterium]
MEKQRINKGALRKGAAEALRVVLALAAFTGAYVAALMVSCAVTAEGVELITGDFTAPELLTFTTLGAQKIDVGFSEDVRLTGAHITTADGEVFADVDRQGNLFSGEHQVSLSKNTVAGERYRFSGVAEDTKGNSLSFSVGFSGFNDEVPDLVLSEVRHDYSKPRAEFIELYAVTGGNLAGVTLLSAYDGVDRIYEFPPCQVEAGEYIVLHYRKIPEEADRCIDETGDDKSLSTATDSSPSRDFWVNNNLACLGTSSDVILLRKRAGGELLDALPYAKSAQTDWKNENVRKAAQEAYGDGKGPWPDGSGIGAAFCIDGASYSCTFSRQNIPAIVEDAADGVYEGEHRGRSFWMVTAAKNFTPGRPNSNVPYTP